MTTETIDFASMPPRVATAIAAVMKGVKRLGKDDTNKHGGYKFTSVDDFLDATRPLCAEAGLIVIQDEEHFETVAMKTAEGKEQTWLLMRFSFTLAHSSGEIWARKITRTIMVMASLGAQAFGAAQSYAEKQFLRSLLQMSTGDQEDADNSPQSDLPSSRTVTKAGIAVTAAETAITMCESLADLKTWKAANVDALKAFPQADADEIVRYFNERVAALKAAPAKEATPFDDDGDQFPGDR
jgi:hypothetical protein